MLHYGIHGFLLTELTVPKTFQSYAFSLECCKSSNENTAFHYYLKDGFSPFGPPLTPRYIYIYIYIHIYLHEQSSRKELSITFHKNLITTLIRYVYCCKATKNAINDLFIWYKKCCHFFTTNFLHSRLIT